MVVSVNGAELFYSTRGTGIPLHRAVHPWNQAVREADAAAADGLLPVRLRGRARRREVHWQSSGSDVRRAGARSGGGPRSISASSASPFLAIRSSVCWRSSTADAALGASRTSSPRERLPPATSRRLVKAATAFFEADGSEERKAILKENYAKLPPGTPPDAGRLCPGADALLRPSVRCAFRCLPRPNSSRNSSSTCSVR